MGITRALAELAVQVSYGHITTSARGATRKLVLDTLGTAIAGWRAPGIRPVVDQMRHWGGCEEATLLTYGGAMPAPNAAFANSCMTHALDYDDTYSAAQLHIMSSVLPVSLAVAEMEHRSGKDLLAAVTMGVEVAARIGFPAVKRDIPRGFLPASVVGGFGATASACRLLDLDAEQTTNALGIYYAQTSGNRQALLDYTLTKRMQPAYTARSAVWSATLAARGVTGAQKALEGTAGFFRVYVGAEPPDLDEVAGLPNAFHIERVSIKQFPSCGGNHRSTQAAIELAKEEDLQPEEIAEVDLWMCESDVWFVGAPFEIGDDPQVSAQFSAAYAVALGLIRRQAGPRQYTAESVVSDDAVADLARRVRIHQIEGTEGKLTYQVPVTLKVATHGGRTFSRTERTLKGSPDDPMTYAEAAEKFRGCADYAGIWPVERVEEVVQTIENLDSVADIASIVRDLLVVEEATTGEQSLGRE